MVDFLQLLIQQNLFNFSRLQFLDLQLELIDDWRVRLLQLLHQDYKDPLVSLVPSILNTVHYVTTVLQDWGSTVVSNLSSQPLHRYMICNKYMS